MDDLTATRPGAGHFPIVAAGTVAAEADWTPIHSAAPLDGGADGVADALGGWPEPGRWIDAGGRRIAWSGRGQAMILGAAPDLPGAALTDQSDAWCRVALTGPGAADVLARLVPVDAAAMAPGDAARTLVGHMMGLVLRTEAGFEIMVFRSMAGTLAHDLGRAMRAVAARRAIA